LIRTVLSEEQWERIAPLLPGKEGDPGRPGGDNRMFVEGCCGSCARAHRGAIFRTASGIGFRCGRASDAGRSRACLKGCSRNYPASRISNMPSSTEPSSRSTGTAPAQKGDSQSGHRHSRGGLTTKIVALVDALGDLDRFVLLPGQRNSSVGVAPLIEGIGIAAPIGDIGFANDWLRK
jgi:hypothetical protein